MTQSIILSSSPFKKDLIGFYPDAINQLTLEEFGLYVLIYYKQPLFREEIYEFSKETALEVDQIIDSLISKGWALEEVIS